MSESQTIQILDKSSMANRDKFITVTSLNSDYVFEGEKITADIKIYFSEGLNEVEPSTFPKIEGLLIKEIPLEKIIQSQETYNGKLYNTAIVKRFEISCETAGVFQIPEIQVTAIKKIKQSNGLLSFYDRERTELFTQAIQLEVIQIPENLPENYLGVFSELDIRTSLPAKQTNSDQAVELGIQLTGVGSFKSLNPPPLSNLKQNYQIYEPELKSSLEDLNFGAKGTAQLKYTLVPKKIGKTETEPFNLYYFNRITKEIDTLQVSGFNVLVKESETAEIQDFNENTTGEITPIPVISLSEPSQPIVSRIGFLGMLGGMFFAGILVFLGLKMNEHKQLVKSLAPPKVGAEKAYEDLELLTASADSEFSSGLLETLEDYLIHKFKLKKADFNKQDILPFTQPELAEKTIKFMKELEMVAFSPASFKGNSDAKDSAVKRAKSLINELEIT